MALGNNSRHTLLADRHITNMIYPAEGAVVMTLINRHFDKHVPNMHASCMRHGLLATMGPDFYFNAYSFACTLACLLGQSNTLSLMMKELIFDETHLIKKPNNQLNTLANYHVHYVMQYSGDTDQLLSLY